MHVDNICGTFLLNNVVLFVSGVLQRMCGFCGLFLSVCGGHVYSIQYDQLTYDLYMSVQTIHDSVSLFCHCALYKR